MRKTCRSSRTPATRLVQLARRREVAAERLLDDDPRPRAEPLGGWTRPEPRSPSRIGRKRGGRDGEVEEAVAAGRPPRLRRLDRRAQRRPGLGLRVVSRGRVDAAGEGGPGRARPPAFPRSARPTAGAAHGRPRLGPTEVLVATTPKGDGRSPHRAQAVERGDDLAVREIPGRAEEDDRARVGRTRGQAGRGARGLDVEGRAHGEGCSPAGRAPARPRNTGAMPTGSTTTNRVRNARRASSLTLARSS